MDEDRGVVLELEKATWMGRLVCEWSRGLNVPQLLQMWQGVAMLGDDAAVPRTFARVLWCSAVVA